MNQTEKIYKQRKTYQFWVKYGLWLGLGFGLITRLIIDLLPLDNEPMALDSPMWWIRRILFVVCSGLLFGWLMRRQAKDALNKLELIEKNGKN